MAQLLGREGSIALDANSVGEVRSWSLTIAAGSIPNNSMGSGEWDTSKTGRKNWSGEASMFYDPADTGQDVAVGAEIVVDLMAEGNTTGLEKRTGTARITEVVLNGDGEGDSLFEYSIKFTGVGSLTTGTVA